MNSVTLNIDKSEVYDEVAKTTAYTGDKKKDDEGAYQRIFTTDGDRLMLERFWGEACDGATEEFKQYITGVTSSDNYSVTLELSAMYDTNLNGSMQSGLFSYFVNTILAKWFRFTDKSGVEDYAKDAAAAMLDVKSKMYYRKRPTRVVPTK